jgi:hypothetical protein
MGLQVHRSKNLKEEETVLHNIQEVTLKAKYEGVERRVKQMAIPAPGLERRHPLTSDAIKITASLFVSRMLEVGTPTFKLTPVHGGAIPGSDAEYLLEIIAPTKEISKLDFDAKVKAEADAKAKADADAAEVQRKKEADAKAKAEADLKAKTAAPVAPVQPVNRPVVQQPVAPFVPPAQQPLVK